MPEPRSADGPLAGLNVVDCSTVLAGPFCSMLLGDLGADVVKVEPPEGDATRGWGPPWVGDEAAGTRTAAYYLAVNRNKRSLRLDLKAEAGKAVLRRLLQRGDVLVENFRVGALARLGFDDDALTALNPGLVHLAISGYGRSGLEASKPGYDFVIQAEGGLMSITGEADAFGGRALKVGVAISDVVSGLFGAVSVLASLVGRERGPTPGEGQRIDVSLLESTLAILINQAQNAFVSGRSPGRRGNAHPNIVPYETFRTSDGEIAVGVGSERQWPRFCEAIGLPELTEDPRFRSNGDRVDHREALIPLISAQLAMRSSAEWLTVLDAADVPNGPILDVLGAFDSPAARARGARVPLTHPVLGEVDQVAPPFELSRTPASIRRPPPLLGEQSAEILTELGYTARQIERLQTDAVV
ncbi:MAG TPA: CaiB/BaiF CoA-transferase family protein [Candidatus Polarisedimenticolia bacterium]|nr:CaiB/BaiF CoA-transferase family protein [Candidatus Polarisedimenticolia bacterium]